VQQLPPTKPRRRDSKRGCTEPKPSRANSAFRQAAQRVIHLFRLRALCSRCLRSKGNCPKLHALVCTSFAEMANSGYAPISELSSSPAVIRSSDESSPIPTVASESSVLITTVAGESSFGPTFPALESSLCRPSESVARTSS
jgi:hypothetical protein